MCLLHFVVPRRPFPPMIATHILFNSYKYSHACLSNFYASPITMSDGKVYKTAEHYYQAMKFKGTPFAETIRTRETPAQARRMGGATVHPIRADWDEVRCDVMREALYAKFTQNEKCRRHLLEITGHSDLVHDASWDAFWGTGKDGKGQNMLGVMLMELREKLRREPKQTETPTAETPEQQIIRLTQEIARLRKENAELREQIGEECSAAAAKRPRNSP